MVALFLLLALAMAAVFLFGTQYAMAIGWRVAARPLVVDYVDRLAGDVGSPPSVERAAALTRKLPLSVRISGPVVNWRSNPEAPDYGRRWQDDGHGAGDDPWASDEPRLFERTTADGHRIRFGLGDAGWQHRPRSIGWLTLGALLLITALAWLWLAHLSSQMTSPMAGMDMSSMPGMDMSTMSAMTPTLEPWTPAHGLFLFAMWAVMMVGMMTPLLTRSATGTRMRLSDLADVYISSGRDSILLMFTER